MDKGKGKFGDAADFLPNFEKVKNYYLPPRQNPLLFSNGTSKDKLPFESNISGRGFNPNPITCNLNVSQNLSVPVNQNFIPNFENGNKPFGYKTINSMLKSISPVNQVPQLYLENNPPYDVINLVPSSIRQPLGLNLTPDSVNTLLNRLSSRPINRPLSSNQEECTNRSILSSKWIDRSSITSSLVNSCSPSSMALVNQLLPPMQVHQKQTLPPPPRPPNAATQAVQCRIRKSNRAVFEETTQRDPLRLKRILINRETTTKAKEMKNPYLSNLELKHKCAHELQIKRSDTLKMDALNCTTRENWINAKEQNELGNSMNEAMKNYATYWRKTIGLGDQHLCANGVVSSSRDRKPPMPDVSALPHFSRFLTSSQQRHHHLSHSLHNNGNVDKPIDIGIQQFPYAIEVLLAKFTSYPADPELCQTTTVPQSQHHEVQSPLEKKLADFELLEFLGLLDFQTVVDQQEQSLIKGLRQSLQGQAQAPSKQKMPYLEQQELTGLLEFHNEFEEEQSFRGQHLMKP